MRHLYRDPRYLILMLLLIVVSGVAGFISRPRLEDPASSVRWGNITTFLPNASPAEVEATVTEPIENALREAKGILSIDSSSLHGVSVIIVRLAEELTDVTDSWVSIQDKLSLVSGNLPVGASSPTLVDEKRWDSFTSVVSLVEESHQRIHPSVLARWAKQLENRIRFVPGTRYTEVFGLPEEEILVELSEESIAATGLAVSEVAQKLRQRDAPAKTTTSRTDRLITPIQSTGDLIDLNEVRNVVVSSTLDGLPLRLKDIASVSRSEKLPSRNPSYVGQNRAVVVASRMDPQNNIDTWTTQYMAELEAFRSTLPSGLSLKLLFTQKKYTDQRASTLYGSLGVGMLLVAATVWFMMGWRAAIPICAALPLTLLGVFFLMIPFGVSLHQMSIAGLILALGMLIDNPIIVTDDIYRRISNGSDREQALVESIQHLAAPLISSNLTTVLGFSPILLIPGPTGEFLGQLGWAVIASLMVSLVLSLTLIPVLSGWLLAPARSSAGDSFRRNNILSLYEWSFRRPALVVAVSLILPVAGFLLAPSLKEQFFPAAERDHFRVSLRLPENTSIRETNRLALAAERIIKRHPEVEWVTLFVGTNAPKIHYSMISADENRPNYAQGLVQLQNERVSNRLISKIQQELDQAIPQAQVTVTQMEQGSPTIAPIEFRIYGSSVDALRELGEQACAAMNEIPGVLYSRATIGSGVAQVAINVRQDESEQTGLSDEIIVEQMRDQLDGVVATSLHEEIEEVPIRVRLASADRADHIRALSLPIFSDKGALVPMRSVADWDIAQDLSCISRRNSQRCNVILGYVKAGELPVAIEKEFRKALVDQSFVVPSGYKVDFGGVSQERNSAVGNLLAYSAIIAVLMLSILVITFRSFQKAILISVVGALSIGLGLSSLYVFSYPIGIVAIIGLLGLMGLAINDSIVVLADAGYATASGESLSTSVFHSTRHVLTTSMTTVAGVLPLILAGGDFWPPMMIVIAGGVVGATLLALGFTPAVYALLRR